MHGPNERLILIVDDSPANLDVISSTLTGAGFEVAVATTGASAIDLAVRDKPDLILLDANMPGMDGFEACRRFKANPATADIAVIIMTALGDAESPLTGLRAGAVDYITRPFQDEEVVARVSTQMNLRRVTRQLAESNERLLLENRERAAVEDQLLRLNRDLEQRVEDRTADLGRALHELEQATVALEREADRRDEQLRDARAQIERELGERARAEEQRTALKEEIIAAQRQNLTELSTPLIPITDRIMVLPLIGTMTEERAEQLLDTALRGVQTHSADVVIIDVTGMKLLDTRVASTLLQTASALRLLGAQAVLTGIRPDLAQTLTTLGVDLVGIVTRGTLKSGIAYALKRSAGAPTGLGETSHED